MRQLTRRLPIGLAAGLALLAHGAQAQRLSGEEIIAALQQGGYVLVMQHAAASLEAARAGSGRGGGFGFGGGGGRGGFGRGGESAPEPTEEALEQESIDMLTGMRHAIWHFQIPIGGVYTSPTRRTTQQADEIPFADITVVDELNPDNADSGWLAAKLTEAPMPDTNVVIVTHGPNIQNDLGLSTAVGETLIVRPGDEPAVVGRLGLREWSVLAIELD